MSSGVKTIWTSEMDDFLKQNYRALTNPALAAHLGLKLTITRDRLRLLGLKRIEMEYWTDEQVHFLQDNYKIMGDVEIAAYFEVHYPKLKNWRKQHIRKKRSYLNLYRTKAEIYKIASANASPGGNSHSIDRNSSSKNMHPMWVAQQIAWRDPELQRELLKHPDIIALKTDQLKLNRAIKAQKDGKNN